MRSLKILVVAMGVMLVIGLGALVAAVAVRLSHRAPALPAAFTAPPIILPHGAKIETMTTAADRIVVQVDLADGGVELVVIDLATGRLVGIIPLQELP
jgi:flagellar basal body-associated protein FliL